MSAGQDHPDNRPDKQPEDQIVQHSRAVFDDAVANLDGATRSRLTRARHAALQAAQAGQESQSRMRWLVPTGSVAALALVGVMSVQFWQAARTPTTTAVVQATVVDDLEIVTADADLDMLKDMDFYAWLDSQDMKAVDASEEG